MQLPLVVTETENSCFFLCGFTAGELMGQDEATEMDAGEVENRTRGGDSQDPVALRLINILTELGAEKVFKE